MVLWIAAALALFGCSCLLQGCFLFPYTNETIGSHTTVPPSSRLTCSSDRRLSGSIRHLENKGFAIDDPTWNSCSDKLLEAWPHSSSKESVRTLRLFAPWQANWSETTRNSSWTNLKSYVSKNNVKVLLGIGVHCDSKYDEQQWKWALELLQLLGKDHIMGVAFGNEQDNVEECFDSFDANVFMTLIQPKVRDLDANGFEDVKITVVWAMGVMYQYPFSDRFRSFLYEAHKIWGRRWVWTFNPYPLWDANMQPQNPDECWKVDKAVALAFTREVMGDCRERVTAVTGDPNSIIWVGEAGWSAPAISDDNQLWIAENCPKWGSQEALFKYYENLMSWDLSVPKGKAVDHMFFFTMRDANDENFGLLGGCSEEKCKVQGSSASSKGANFVTV